jgi:hypothetical protein
MSNFVPDTGTLFYVEKRPIRKDVEGLFGGVTQAIVVDTSYSSNVFKCVGSDNTMVVGRLVHASYMIEGQENNNYLFKINMHTFQPVGPEVAKVLNLTEETKDEQS